MGNTKVVKLGEKMVVMKGGGRDYYLAERMALYLVVLKVAW